MKTRNILAALLLMACTTMLADGFKYLTITYNGTEENISLPIVKKIFFQDGNVVVTTTEGEYTYPISIMERITFTESADAIKALPEQAENLTYENGTLSIKGNGLMSIYNTNGALISIGFESQQLIVHRGVIRGLAPNAGNPFYDFQHWEILLK